MQDLLEALIAARKGDFSQRMSIRQKGVMRDIALNYNELIEAQSRVTKELARLAKIIGREGRMTERAVVPAASGEWAAALEAVNDLIDDLVRPTTEIARVMDAVADGDLTQKMQLKIGGQAVKGEFLRIGTTVNEMVDQLSSFADEVTRVAREVGTDGKLGGQATVKGVSGTWRDLTDSVNFMASNLTDQVRNIATVTTAVANGDLSQKITVDARGEILELKDTINTMVDQLSSFADEVTRVAREVGTEGKLGGQAEVKGVSGTWRDLTENVNLMANNLTDQVRNVAAVTTAVANGDLTQKITVEAKGEVAALADTINSMTDTLQTFAEQVTTVAREVGTDGKLGGQAQVPGVAGTWKDLTDHVNLMANNLTTQVRNIATVTTAVANGDLTQEITVEAKGEVAALADTINTMVDQLSSFADEVTRVAREVGTEGKLGGQAEVKGVSGTWRDLTDNVNLMANNLTDQVRNVAAVTTAIANGDLSQKITVEAKGEVAALADTINTMVDQLRSFAAEVTRVAREVGTDGKLGGQAEVEGVSGTWRDLTESVNFMASNLTDQVRNIAQVATAVAEGDLGQKITVEAKGEVAALADTINTMTDTLQKFAAEVTRVAREVGTEGSLGGQAEVEGVSGTWRGLTENVNLMANNLTDQVRNIAQVATAVANGDLSQKITVDARGEILQLKNTLNTMVDQLSSFADEVTRVAREVGTEGKLGGQAEVEGVSGTWRGLTENVNQLASNLTTQVRAIREVASSVTQGDLTRSIDVEAQGEVAELKDNINQMISNLRVTTEANEQQDWLKTNLARISGLMQGQRDLRTVSRMIMSELTPTVSAQLGAFYMAEPSDDNESVLRLIASYGYKKRKNLSNEFQLGEGLVGQAAVEKSPIVVKNAPDDYVKITSGLGEGEPVNIIDLPILFEDQVLGVIELASFEAFSDIHLTFLEQLMETIGVVLNTLIANMRTEGLLQQSQSLTQELQSQSEELQERQEELKQSNTELEEQAQSLKASEELLQQQQEELQQTNEELQEKAALLERQNRDIEIKNREIELARAGLEERAEQLALSSKYKSEFLANMSHELRTPLNSLLILSNMLAENPAGNLDEKQVEFAKTINTAGTDLLELINDILDLSKVEAGRMDVHASQLEIPVVCEYVEQTFQPVASEKQIEFEVIVEDGVPESIATDEQRLQQVLRNLLANAFKFTEMGRVELRVAPAGPNVVFANDQLVRSEAIAFAVTDTGIGIDADKLRLIFEAFQQADGTTSRRYGGTGLGLSISREIARLLGGEIQATSEVGEGSTFTLYLPREYRAPERPLATVRETPMQAQAAEAAPAARTNEAALAGIRDDRDAINPGELVCLVIDEDPQLARTLLDTARTAGFKGLVSLRHDSGVALARDWAPDSIVLGSGLATLYQLKQAPETRHIPVQVISDAEERHDALAAGAAGHIARPPADEDLSAAFSDLSRFIERPEKRLLIVDDEEAARKSIAELLGGEDVAITAVGSSEAALEALENQAFDCIVLDLKLPKMSGFDLLERLGGDEQLRDIPVIVHTGKELTKRQETKLRRYAKTIIVKDARSPERLVAETSLFLHRPKSALDAEQRRLLEQVHTADAVFAGKKVLVVDDDVRNLFALASALEARGMEVLFAENGREGLECLDQNNDVDLVLMDVMMPEMDGYEATRALRERPAFKDLPIICLTAKAMKGDREKSIQAGASDYITKPVDIEQLLSLMQVWLYR